MSSESAARLRSQRGHRDLCIEAIRSRVHGSEDGLDTTLHLRSESFGVDDNTYPVTTTIEGLWLRRAELEPLRDHIGHWTRQPLDRLIPDALTRAFELTRLPDQQLRIAFGPREDTVSKRDPVVSIHFGAGALRGELHFVTDQSCLALFAQSLAAVLRRTSSAPR